MKLAEFVEIVRDIPSFENYRTATVIGCGLFRASLSKLTIDSFI